MRNVFKHLSKIPAARFFPGILLMQRRCKLVYLTLENSDIPLLHRIHRRQLRFVLHLLRVSRQFSDFSLDSPESDQFPGSQRHHSQ